MNRFTSPFRYRVPGILMLSVAGTGVLFAEARAQGAGWPNRPIKLLVGFPAGGASGKINFGSFGASTSGGLATEMVKLMTKADMQHIPYNGGAPAMQALLGGHIDLYFDTVVTALQNVKAGKVVPLAVSGAKRTSLAPDLPTVAETLPGFEADSWTGLMVPAGTPPDVVARLQEEIAKMVASPDIKEKFTAMGAERVGNSSADFSRYLAEETTRYAKLVKEANLKLE